MQSKVRWVASILFLGVSALTAGCGHGGPKTYPVQGRITLAGGDVKDLAGSHIEAALVGDPLVRSSGVIQSDGTFKLETLHAGSALRGARAGRYEVRLVLPDDDRELRRRAAQTIAARFLDFRTSQLAIDVPATRNVEMTVTSR